MAAARRGIAVWVAAAAASLTTAQSEPELARVACDAKHNTPCARTNSEFLAWDTARQFTEQVAAGASADDVLRQITDGDFNIASGFYPFVFDAATSELLAHGERSTLVGQQLPQVFEGLNLQYSDPQLLHDRFVAAANTPDGDWVQYLWPTQTRDGSFMATSKQSYVVGINRGIGGPLLCLGVGFADTPLPLQLPCSDKYDTLCATNNVRSLVGNAQTLLSKADSRANFEEYLLQLSYDVDEFQVPGGLYIFTYSFDGPLVSHARLHQMFGMNLAEIFSALDRSEDGDQLHQDFIAAAQGAGDGWVRYQWRNSLEEEPYTKIAYVVKVDFGGTSYYIGAGFNFVMAPAMAGPLAEVCPVAYNFPCAVTNTLQLSSHAVVRAARVS
jgi:signal transduction histidine kinase